LTGNAVDRDPVRPIPFTVIGGFLGAGKTTLLNRVLREPDGVRYAVLVNDFGALDVDAGLIVAHDGETIALANGCLCCSIGDSLVDTLVDLMARPDPADHILVEASGVADPKRIADIAVIDPALARDGIVVLVDAAEVRRLAADPRVGDAVLRQLAVADLLVVNKADLVDPSTLDALDAWLAERAPRAPRLRAIRGELPVHVLLDRVASSPAGDPGATRGIADRTGHEPGRPQHREPRSEPDPGLGGGRGHAHEDDFRRVLLTDLPVLSREAMAEFARGLPDTVLRVKGFVAIAGGAAPQLFQRVGRRWSLEAAAPGSTPPLGLVLIGTPGMPGEAALRRELAAAADLPRLPESAP
jgi:G3E family GTPase